MIAMRTFIPNPPVSRGAVMLASFELPQKQVALAAGVSQMTISKILRGRLPVTDRFIMAITDLAGEDAAVCILEAIGPPS